MKKSLLFLAFSTFSFLGFSQAPIFQVLTPESQEGIYPVVTSPEPANGWTNMPDLFIPANSVTGELVFVTDGTAGDSLGCFPLTNGADVDGKIAVVWRGTCQFGQKALNAWEAGAIAVIIVNRNPGEGALGMLAGDFGGAVTVPVVMTDFETGVLLGEEILAGTVTAYLGVPNFDNDLAMLNGFALRPNWAAKPISILQNEEEFTLPIGAFVANYGSNFQTGVTLNATVTFNNEVIYDETMGDFEMETGDTTYVALPVFSQPGGAQLGEYELIYTIFSDLVEEFEVNNAPITVPFTVTSDIFSYNYVNPETEMIEPTLFSRLVAADFNDFFETCAHFRDANASRLRADGIHTAATNSSLLSGLAEQILEVRIYPWLDEFEDVTTTPPQVLLDQTFAADDFLAYGEFAYTSEDQSGDVVYVPFFDPIVLQDDVRYLFCVRSGSDSLNLAFATSQIDYLTTLEEYLQPISPIRTSSTFFWRGFGEDTAPGHAVTLVDITVGTDDAKKIDITPYPNPTRDFIAIPYAGSAASATIHIYDLTGRLVKAVNANYGGNNMIEVDMNGVTNGSYVFNMQFNDNTSSTFKVVVAR